MVENIIRILLQNTIFVSSIVLLIILAYPLLQKLFIPRLRCLIWLLLIIRLLLPIQTGFIELPVKVDFPTNHIYLENTDSYLTEPSVFLAEETPQHLNNLNLSPYSIIAIIWITGVIAYSLFYIIKYNEFKKSIKNSSQTIYDKDIQNLLENLLLEIDLKPRKAITIKECALINTPMMMGIINPVLLVPNRNYDNDSLRIIITHELIHFYNKDILFKYLLLSCDHQVVNGKDLAFRKYYSDLIVSHINIAPIDKGILFTNLGGNKNNIKSRIKEIFNFKTRKKGNYLLLSLIPILMLISPNIIESTIKNNIDLELIEREEQYQIELFDEFFTSFGIDSNGYKIIQYDDKLLYDEITRLFRVDDPIPSSSYGDTKLYYFVDDNELEGLAMKQDINGINYLYRFEVDESSRSGWKITDRKQVQGEVIYFDDYFIENPTPKSFEEPVVDENSKLK